MYKFILGLALVCYASGAMALDAKAQSGDITITSWNLEHGWAPRSDLTQTMAMLRGLPASDIWVFEEAGALNWPGALNLNAATPSTYNAFVSGNAGEDRLVVVYDRRRFTRVGQPLELQHVDGVEDGAAPLAITLEDQANGEVFTLLAVHLSRRDDVARLLQSARINDWAGSHPFPIIAVGSFNYDWRLDDLDPNPDPGFAALTRHHLLTWAFPLEPRPTQCNRVETWILDFFFLGGPARGWAHSVENLMDYDALCPDNQDLPDHLPIKLTIAP